MVVESWPKIEVRVVARRSSLWEKRRRDWTYLESQSLLQVRDKIQYERPVRKEAVYSPQSFSKVSPALVVWVNGLTNDVY